jgi:hypothetical protein
VVLLRVIPNELLGESPCGGNKVGYSNCGCGRICGPNTVYHTLTTNSDTSRIDEKIKFFVTKKRDPVEPLNIGRSTGRPDRTWRQAHGGKSHGATGRTLDRRLNIPIGGIMGGEVVLEGALELNESNVRVRTDELFGEKDDDTGDSGGERKRRIHCVIKREKARLSTGDRDIETKRRELLRELCGRGL